MKHNNSGSKRTTVSIKWSIFLYLLAFTVVIVTLLWLCQVVFFDNIYKGIRTSEVKSCCAEIENAIDSNDEAEKVDEAADKSDVCVSVFEVEENQYYNTEENSYYTPYNQKYVMTTIYSYHTVNNCLIHSIDRNTFSDLYDSALENGGSQLQRFKVNEKRREYIGIEGDVFGNTDGTSKPKIDIESLPESIIYTRITKNVSGNTIMILLNATVSPVDSTVRTLNRMLIAITAILVVFALLLAFLISTRVSKPIQKLTKSAKHLASGDYDTEFPRTGYKEAVELSDALNYAQTELSKSESLRRELIANISHDLRTPLTMIGGYSEIMRDIPGENTPENVQVIIEETKRLTSLVNDLLDISQIESGIGTNNKTVFLLTDTLKNVLTRFSKLCERDGYRINFICDGDIYVSADEKRITQAVYNLIGNAVNHTGDDKLVTVTQECANGWVRISVTDTGEGILPENLPYIWDRYYKVDKVHKRSVIGTGLGLSIVKNVMNINGGRYGVQSTVGTGSTFYIELPVIPYNIEAKQ